MPITNGGRNKEDNKIVEIVIMIAVIGWFARTARSREETTMKWKLCPSIAPAVIAGSALAFSCLALSGCASTQARLDKMNLHVVDKTRTSEPQIKAVAATAASRLLRSNSRTTLLPVSLM